MTDFVAADCGIRQLHARFVDAVWRKDAAAFADCFTENAEWKIAAMHIRGRNEIGSFFDKVMAICARVQLIAGTPILEVGDGTATGRINVTELAKMTDGSSAMTLGVYYDRYAEEDGRWRFSWRHFGLQYRGPIDFSGDLVNSPEYGAHPGMPADDEPTVTRRAPVN